MDTKKLEKLARLVRYYSLTASTEAGSGHPTSSLSAADLMVALMFGGFFRYDIHDPNYHNNDRLIFSKGHASPLYYALWAAAGELSETDLKTFRQFKSVLEGHPSMRFAYTEAATGSLGQGLSIGLGMAVSAKYLDRLPNRTFVLLGDSEMAEGQIWEAMQLAAHYKLDNLIAIVDVNRLGQRGETMYGHDLENYKKKAEAFGWEVITCDGHNLEEIGKAYGWALRAGYKPQGVLRGNREEQGKPKMIIAKTIKGKGVSFAEGENGWHGKAFNKVDYQKAIREIGETEKNITGSFATPAKIEHTNGESKNFDEKFKTEYRVGEKIATRKAYGQALKRIYLKYREMVVLDGEVGNSTYSEIFAKQFPKRFFEMFIAEQNMVGAAVGLARRGKLPFVSTFAAFLTRAFDQIRMANYSGVKIVFCGSHAGVSIGEDGPSQMGLEDIAMFRSLLNSVVLYPADAVACDRLVEEAARYNNISYMRTTRMETPIIYSPQAQFPVGGSKVLRQSKSDRATIVAAGITLHEALKAAEILKKSRINVRVIDVYSVKPLDRKTLETAAKETKRIITVEDHFAEGGIGEAVASTLAQVASDKCRVASLAVRKMPRSGKPEELLDYEGISAKAIVSEVKKLLKKR